MNSTIKSKNNFFTGTLEVQYLVELDLSSNKELPAKFAWNLLHNVLPREVRNGGFIENIKGMNYNNILLNGLPGFELENENLIFHVDGTAKALSLDNLEESENKEDSFYSVKTDFHAFRDRRNIQYKSNIFFEGSLHSFLEKPIYEYDKDIEIKNLFLGLEFFEPNLFWLIGLAPRITKACLLQMYKEKVYIRYKLEQKQRERGFFGHFGEIIEKQNALILDMLGTDLEKDFNKKLT